MKYVDYYAFPKELLVDSEYTAFSIEAKMLFSMVLTEAEKANTIVELAHLIDTIGDRNIGSIFSKTSDEIRNHLENSEDYSDV